MECGFRALDVGHHSLCAGAAPPSLLSTYSVPALSVVLKQEAVLVGARGQLQGPESIP